MSPSRRSSVSPARAIIGLAALICFLFPVSNLWSRPAGKNKTKPAKILSLHASVASSANQIAFVSDRDENLEIYVMDADGGGQIRLTENPGEDHSPAWSPDGTRLAFVSTRDGNAEIYVMNSDGTGQTRLTQNSATDLNPAWHVDGGRIGFVSDRDGNDEIYLMNSDGTNQVNLTNNPAEDSSFSFSPDGSMIAFSSSREDSQFEVYVGSVGQSDGRRLTTAIGDDINPAWAQQIVFQSNRDDNDEIYSMGPAGGGETRLTNNTEIDLDPTQSGDGKIVFSSSRDGNLEIYVLNANGGGITRLTTNNFSDVQPALKPGTVIPPPPAAGTPTIQFTLETFSAAETAQFGTLTVTRTGGSTGPASVDFSTVNGTATNRSDYIGNFGTLRFASGETTKSIQVLLTDDVYEEFDETISVTLGNPTGAVLGNLNTAVLSIIDNDTALPSVNPINDARFFVNQHYSDFLNRVPDQGGLDYWTNQITMCGANIDCVLARRNGVSAAFFIETEFQLTGYFVYRLHQASFGRLPSRQNFIMDRSRVSVGPNLDADKLALANDFVMRSEFLARYPANFTPAEFVNKLFDTAGLVPFTAERQRFIQDMQNGKTRAQVLIEVIEIPQYRDREFNRAFILMQYFAYLGRDPEPGGFDFWLDVLNNRAPNNYPGLVCAFITSAEYQLRFSPVVTADNSQCSVIP
jgi:WD40 repeat protein